jgi:phage tail sheath protein FI
VGTAPNADPTVFPLNTPVLIAGSETLAAKLISGASGPDNGTLPAAVNDIFEQGGAVIVVVRVDTAKDPAAQAQLVIGGVSTVDGSYTGMHAMLAANSVLGSHPRILIAPGFTSQRTIGGVIAVAATTAGAGYTDGTYTLNVVGGAGAGASGTATVVGGTVVSTAVVTNGSNYTSAPTFTLPGAAGVPTTAAVFSATYGTTANAVAAESIGILNRLGAVMPLDGPNTNDADAIAYAGDFGSKRLFLVDPGIVTTDMVTGANVVRPSSAMVAGLIAQIDNTLGFWWSPSNQTLNGVLATARPVDFTLGDPNSRANLLNAANVATIVRLNGYRLWGNRTLSSDPKWAFLSVVRTADIINDSLLAAHLWAVDRGITKTYVDAVLENVNAFLRQLTALGAILGGKCWIDKDLNPATSIAGGKVFFDFNFTPPFPAEDITFRSHLVNDYVQTIF